MHNSLLVYDYDLVIVGGGLAGASLALALTQAFDKLKILVLEQKAPELAQYHQDFDQKTLAINQYTKEFFDKLKIWPADVALNDILTPIKQVHVSMQKAFGQFHFTPPKEYKALGYIIQAKYLESLILEKLLPIQNSGKLTWVQPIRELNLQAMPGGWKIGYIDGRENKKHQVSCQCIIGSDGPSSTIKKNLGISDRHSDYHHIATIANVDLTQHHENIAYERFTQDGGAIALLPYGSKRMTLIYTESTEKAKATQGLSDGDFLEKLTKNMGNRLGFTAISKRTQVPLGMKIALHQIARRAILMGNAAHFLHPIAAQGFNLSIQDIVGLIKTIHQDNHQKDLGSTAMLHDYLLAREFIQAQYIGMTDKIATHYASHQWPAWMKGLSLFCLDNIGVKNYFTEKSMGIA